MWSLRFDLANINKQCQPCNTEKHGNLLEYRINLIKKIGQAEVDRLEGPQPIKKYTVHELKNLAAYFRAKLKALKQSSKEAV